MSPRFRAGRRRGLAIGAAAGAAVAHHLTKKSAPDTAGNEAAAADPVDSDKQLAQLQQLGELRDNGILTEEEFQAKKKDILGG